MKDQGEKSWFGEYGEKAQWLYGHSLYTGDYKEFLSSPFV